MPILSEKYDYIWMAMAKIVIAISIAIMVIVPLYKFVDPTFFNGLTPRTDSRMIGLNLVIDWMFYGGILAGFPCIAIGACRALTGGKKSGKLLVVGISALLLGVCVAGVAYSQFAPRPLYNYWSIPKQFARLAFVN